MSAKLEDRINKLEFFLKSLTNLIYYNGHVTVCITKNKLHIFQPYLIDSSVKTLKSIKYCCQIKSFSDANSLVRKFRDDLLLYLYILEVLNNRQNTDGKFIKEFSESNELDSEKFIEILKGVVDSKSNENIKNEHDICVDAWFDNEVYLLPKSLQKKLSIETYINYLEVNDLIKRIILNYGLKSVWESIRIKLNSYVHNKGQSYTQDNILLKPNVKRIEISYQEVIQKLEFITTFFTMLLILINPAMIQSTDYIDCLESDLIPPENSQYIIAPFIQEFINKYIYELNPELKAFLKYNNKFGMLID